MAVAGGVAQILSREEAAQAKEAGEGLGSIVPENNEPHNVGPYLCCLLLSLLGPSQAGIAHKC